MVANKKVDQNNRHSNWAALRWLAVAAVLLLFANGRDTIGAAAWLAPVVLLRFVRTQRAWRGLLGAGVVLLGTWAFQFRGMVPLPGLWFWVVALVYALIALIPFIVDRLVAPRFGGFLATLVFPSAWAGTEYLVATLTPYGSWGAVAYSQHESLVLLQLVSLTGIYGLTFLIGWFAAVCNWVWERVPRAQSVSRGLLGFAAVLAAVLVYGGARLALFPPDAPTVRVASLTRPDLSLFPNRDVARRASQGRATAAEMREIRARADRINSDLLRRSEREARAGAKIVFWGETNAFVLKEDEPALLQRGASLARSQGIYLGLGLAVWTAGRPQPLENKIVLFDPRGTLAVSMLKARPIPGPEAAISARGEGRIKTVVTPYGKLGAAICFDMDFPGLLQQAGDLDVDLMLVPSNDWREISPWHSHMARVRAVEQGFNLVRHVSGGLSLAADHQGRVLASMDHYRTANRVLVSQVPTRGVRTVYSRVGDLFAWLCLAGLLGLIALAWKRRSQGR